MAPIDPVRDGRFWLFDDGTRLPVVSGGAVDEEETESDGETGGEPPPAATVDPSELVRTQAALTKANKEAEKYRLKVKEFEDSQKTEIQRLTDEKTAAENDALQARLEHLRLKVGTEKGLPSALAERLRGDTEAELAADAEKVSQLIGKPPAKRGSADAGARKTPTSKTDMNGVLRKAAKT